MDERSKRDRILVKTYSRVGFYNADAVEIDRPELQAQAYQLKTLSTVVGTQAD